MGTAVSVVLVVVVPVEVTVSVVTVVSLVSVTEVEVVTGSEQANCKIRNGIIVSIRHSLHTDYISRIIRCAYLFECSLSYFLGAQEESGRE
jgi:hypothetical protein